MIKIWVCKDWNKDYKNLGCFGWDRSDRWDRPAGPVVHDLIHLFWPITNKIITLSLSPLLTSSHTHSLSPSRSLSLPLSLTVPSLSPKSQTPNPHPQINLMAKKASNPCGGPSSPRIHPRAALDFEFFVWGKSSFKILQLVPPRSIFLGGSKWFPLVHRLFMHPSTRI